MRIVVLEREGTERVAQLPHHRRGLHALPDDVADDEADAAVLELDDVVPVPSDVDADRARQVASGERDPSHRREPLRQNAPLHRLRDPALGLVTSRPIERLLALADERLQPLPVCVGQRRARAVTRAASAPLASGSAIQPSPDQIGRPARRQLRISASAPSGISPSAPSTPIDATTPTLVGDGLPAGPLQHDERLPARRSPPPRARGKCGSRPRASPPARARRSRPGACGSLPAEARCRSKSCARSSA